MVRMDGTVFDSENGWRVVRMETRSALGIMLAEHTRRWRLGSWIVPVSDGSGAA